MESQHKPCESIKAKLLLKDITQGGGGVWWWYSGCVLGLGGWGGGGWCGVLVVFWIEVRCV